MLNIYIQNKDNPPSLRALQSTSISIHATYSSLPSSCSHAFAGVQRSYLRILSQGVPSEAERNWLKLGLNASHRSPNPSHTMISFRLYDGSLSRTPLRAALGMSIRTRAMPIGFILHLVPCAHSPSA